MRETRSWRQKAAQSLEKTKLHKDQIEALIDLELCLFAVEKLGIQTELETAISVWLLISNRYYLFPRLTSLIQNSEAKRTLFNIRQLVPYLTNEDATERLIKVYNQISSKYRAYDVDNKTYRFSQKSMPSIWGNRFESFEDLLSNKLKYRQRTVKYASPGKEYCFKSEGKAYSVRLPEDLPTYPGRVISVHRDNNKAIYITKEEMQEAANILDERCGEDHKKRLQNIIIEHFQGMGYVEINTIAFDGVKNLVGLLNAGKSTLIEILTVALATKKHRVGIVFNEVVTCLRMASLLKKVGLRVSVVVGQRSRGTHLENWHGVNGGLDGFTHLSTACPLSKYFQPENPASPPCFDLREVKDDSEDDSEDESRSNSKRNGPKVCPLIGQCPRHRDANELADSDVILTTVAAAIFTRPLPHVSPQSITYYELMYRTCNVVFFDECDKVQSNLDSTFLPAIKLIERGSNGFLDQVVTWTRTTKLRNSRNDLRQLAFGQFNHALQNADALVDNIYTQLQLSPDESKWLAEKFFTCSSIARGFVLEIAKSEGIDTDSETFILDKNPVYEELSTFLQGDWKDSWLAEYAMRLNHENYQEQQETIAKIQNELTKKGWLKAISDKWGFCCKFALFLKLALFVSYFQQSIKIAYALEQQVDGADEIVFFNRIPRDFYGLIPGLASGLVCGFKLEQQENQLTLWYFQALGQGRWLLENFSSVFAGEGTQGAHALLLSGTSWAGQSPLYHVNKEVDYLLRPKVKKSVENISESSFHFTECYYPDGKPVRVSGVTNKEEALLQIVRSLLRSTDTMQRDFDALPEGRKRLIWYVNSYEQVDFVYKAINSIDTSSYWKDRVGKLTSRSPLEDIDESLIPRSNVENFADTKLAILLAPISAIGRGKNILNSEGLSAFGGAYFLVRPHPAPDDLEYKFRLALWRERKAIASEREGNFIEACNAWKSEGYGIFLKSLDTELRYSYKGLSKEVREGLIWSLMVLTWQAIARTIRGNQPTLIRFIDAAWAPNLALKQPETEKDSLLKGFKYVLQPYFSKTRTGFDAHDIALVRSLYEPFYRALEKINGI
jgi:pPIWI RE three-gene island domain Z